MLSEASEGASGCQMEAVLTEGKGSRGVCGAIFLAFVSSITAVSTLMAATRPSDPSWLRYFCRIYAVITKHCQSCGKLATHTQI